MAVKRYFAGYPKPRLRPGPLLFAAFWVVLALPATSELAAAVFVPLEKVRHGGVPVAVSSDTRVVEPPPPPPHEPHFFHACMLHRPGQIAIDREPLPLRRGSRSVAPDSALAERTRASGRALVAVFRICFDGHGQVQTVRRLRDSGEPQWEAALAEAIHGWRYARDERWSGGHGLLVCTVEQFRFDP